MRKLKLTKAAEFRATVEKVVAMLSERGLPVTQNGIRAFVRYDDDGLPILVNIPTIPENADEGFLAAIRGFIDHEVGHVLETDGPGIVAAVVKKPKAKHLINVIEDVRIERAMRNRFGGTGQHLEDLWDFLSEKMILPMAKQAGSDPELFPILLPSIIHAWSGKRSSQELMDQNGFWPRVEKLTKVLEPFKAELQAGKLASTQDACDLAERMFKAVEKAAEPPPPPSPPPVSPPNEKCEEESKKESDDEEETNSSAPSDEQNEQDEQDEPSEQSESDPEAEPSEAEPSEAEQPQDDEPGEGASDAEPDEEDAGESDEENQDEQGKGEDQGEGDESEEGDKPSEGEGADEEDSAEQSQDEADGQADGQVEEETAGDEETSEAGDSTAESEDAEDEVAEGEVGPAEEEPLQAEPDPTQGLIDSAEFLEEVTDAEEAFTSSAEAAVLHNLTDDEYLVWSKDGDEFRVITNTDKARVEQEALRMDEQTNRLAGQLANHFRRMFAQQEQVVTVGGLRRGRLNAPALFKLGLGDDRVFCQREEHSATNTAVSLVIDNSGSMDGEKLDLALASANAFSATLDRVGIAHEVLGFTTKAGITNDEYAEMAGQVSKMGRHFSRWDTILIPVYKTFTEPYRVARLRFAAMRDSVKASANVRLGANIDGESIEYAALRLAARQEPRKVMIVFSDGMPAGYGLGSHLQSHLTQTVKRLDAGGIETLGVGIMTNDVLRYYRKAVVVNKVEELPVKVMKELEKMLLH